MERGVKKDMKDRKKIIKDTKLVMTLG